MLYTIYNVIRNLVVDIRKKRQEAADKLKPEPSNSRAQIETEPNAHVVNRLDIKTINNTSTSGKNTLKYIKPVDEDQYMPYIKQDYKIELAQYPNDNLIENKLFK